MVGRTGGGRALVIFSPLYLYFADMSSHVDILHPTCPKCGNVITHRFGKIQVRQDKDNIRHNVVMARHYAEISLRHDTIDNLVNEGFVIFWLPS
jgi:hypothetical protein